MKLCLPAFYLKIFWTLGICSFFNGFWKFKRIFYSTFIAEYFLFWEELSNNSFSPSSCEFRFVPLRTYFGNWSLFGLHFNTLVMFLAAKFQIYLWRWLKLLVQIKPQYLHLVHLWFGYFRYWFQNGSWWDSSDLLIGTFNEHQLSLRDSDVCSLLLPGLEVRLDWGFCFSAHGPLMVVLYWHRLGLRGLSSFINKIVCLQLHHHTGF